jgi:hypothetical protein
MKALTGPGTPPRARPRTFRQLFPVKSGFLLRTGQRELLLDDPLSEQEPGIIVAGLHDVLEGAERVEAGVKGRRQPPAARVKPER